MSWASERLQALNQQYSYREITEITGIPASTISYVIREQRVLPSQYILNLKSLYSRYAYSQLRTAGLSVALSSRYRWYTPAHLGDILREATDLVSRLVDYRYESYRQYLQTHGKYTTDADVRQRLSDAIRRSLSRRQIQAGDDINTDSPTLRHIV